MRLGVFIFRSEISAPGRLTGFTPKHIFLCLCRYFCLNQKYRKTNQIFVFSIHFYLRKSSYDNYLRLLNALYRRRKKLFCRRRTCENINDAAQCFEPIHFMDKNIRRHRRVMKFGTDIFFVKTKKNMNFYENRPRPPPPSHTTQNEFWAKNFCLLTKSPATWHKPSFVFTSHFEE